MNKSFESRATRYTRNKLNNIPKENDEDDIYYRLFVIDRDNQDRLWNGESIKDE